MIKVSHEVPICLLEDSRQFNDYDYCLVHLLDKYPKYLKFFKDSLSEGREVLLDNSIFELEVAFNTERFIEWIEKLKPTYYVIPDVLEDLDGTVNNLHKWFEHPLTNSLPGEAIGVVQGKSEADAIRCYQALSSVKEISTIAISFNYSFYKETTPHPVTPVAWALGRVKFLSRLLEDGIIDTKKKHHLLGASCAIEFKFYDFNNHFSWLTSLDTSNPVVHGMLGIPYEDKVGLLYKRPEKLADLIDRTRKSINLGMVLRNVNIFREILHS